MNNDREPQTEVILVVKGAGVQKPYETMNSFLEGFLPAIKFLDPNATIISRPLPFYPEKEITEILTTPDSEKEGARKRIWVTESYWEDELTLTSPISNLFKEWRMASYAYTKLVHSIFEDQAQEPAEKIKNRLAYFMEFFWPSLFILGAFILLLLLILRQDWGQLIQDVEMVSSVKESGLTDLITTPSGAVIGFFVLCILLALAPALEFYGIMKKHHQKKEPDSKKGSQNESLSPEGTSLTKIPTMPTWISVVLGFLLLSKPIAYLTILAGLFVLQLSILMARRIMYSMRGEGYKEPIFFGHHDRKPVTRFIKRICQLFFMPIIYRMFIILALPITILAYFFVKLLKWTHIFASIGEAVDQIFFLVFSKIMGDVVNYAMNPAQANQVRSVVSNDIMLFHKCKEVKHIHIFAHSQGTPITYEAIFGYLDQDYQSKIKSYITIGSVLSLYKQAEDVIDLVYHNRFEIHHQEQNLADDFRWINFWNFTDPITEFYGLDEYIFSKETKKTSKYTPINIRSKTSLRKNHSEYWTNLEQVQIPFAKRVLGENKPNRWQPYMDAQPETADQKQESIINYLSIPILSLGIFAFFFFVGWYSIELVPLNQLLDIFTQIFAPLIKMLDDLFPALGFKKWPDQILSYTLLTALILGLMTWFYRIVRAVRILREVHLKNSQS